MRSLGLITHLMMMQLNYPASSGIFFATVFEYVTFDMVPTDEIFGEIFDFDSEPYSDQADQVGYGSRFFIENTGSLIIYVVIIVAELIVYGLVLACTKKDQCVKCRNFSDQKQADFLWAGAIDFMSELYMNIAFSIGINLSWREFTNSSVRFNNVFGIVFGVIILVGPIIMAI